MVLTMVAERKNSPSSGRPSTSSLTVWVKFPCATAAMARVTSAVGRRRSSTRVFTDPSISPHAPRPSLNRARSRVRPSLPTTCPTRRSSRAICWLAATMSLNVSAILPPSPVHDPGSRTEKSPSRILCRPVSTTAKSNSPGSPITCGWPLPLKTAVAAAAPLSAELLALRLAVFIYVSRATFGEQWNGMFSRRCVERCCAVSKGYACRGDTSFYIPRKTCAASTVFLVLSANLGKKQQNGGRREQLQQTDGTICSARHSSGPDSRFFFSGGATLLPSELK